MAKRAITEARMSWLTKIGKPASFEDRYLGIESER